MEIYHMYTNHFAVHYSTFKMTLWLSEDPASAVRRWVQQGSVIRAWCRGQKGGGGTQGGMVEPGPSRTGCPLLGGWQWERCPSEGTDSSGPTFHAALAYSWP